jgi:hypothetical protein
MDMNNHRLNKNKTYIKVQRKYPMEENGKSVDWRYNQ